MPQPNKQLLQYLYDVLVKGLSPPSHQPTPGKLNPSFTPNQKFLQAAVAYTKACFLKLPGTNSSQARKLAQLAFQLQQQHGHHCIPHDPSQGGGLGPTGAIETLTPTHAQLWHAGGAALLYCALQTGDNNLIPLAQSWWRAEAALNHLTAWQKSWNLGGYQVIAPGARGGSDAGAGGGDPDAPPAAQNSARDLDYELLLTGKLAHASVGQLQQQGRYFTAPLVLLKLKPAQLKVLNQPGSGAKLAGPGGVLGPWTVDDVPTLPSPLSVLRNADQHSAWFGRLDALEPQLQAGVDAGGAWYNFYNSPQPPPPPPADLANGGQSPWPDPTQPGGQVEKYGPQPA
jgi:hypothetical protein